MSVKVSQVFTKIDIIKIIILLLVAIIAWYFVYREYSKPFDILEEIKRQQMIQKIEAHKLKPIIQEEEN